MRVMLEFLTEDGRFQVLFIIFLEFLSTGKYIFYQM